VRRSLWSRLNEDPESWNDILVRVEDEHCNIASRVVCTDMFGMISDVFQYNKFGLS
jgi:hypothetical protein